MEHMEFFVQGLHRIEAKLDDIRDKMHDIDLAGTETKVRQTALELEVHNLKQNMNLLKTAHDKQLGAYKLLMAPGLLSFIYAALQLLQKLP